MYALSHDSVRLKSPLSALKASPGFWFLVAGAAYAAIVVGGVAGFTLLAALVIAGAAFWPALDRILRSW